MIYENIVEKIQIEKGWSPDKKYRVITKSGEIYLLRVSPEDRAERIQQQFVRMQEAAALDIPMCMPMEQGICEDGPYLLQSWVEGVDAEPGLAVLSEAQQYAYGLEAGRMLKKLHSLPAPSDVIPWAEYFNRKIDRKLSAYENCALKYENGDVLVQYVRTHRHLLKDRPKTYQHGDYHCGNLMIDKQGVLTVIDFDKWDFGDPWEEFNRIVWCAQLSPAFASGRVDGYFDGEVPEDFWQLLALYICNNCIGSLPWAIPFGEGEIQVMRRQAANILRWYDNFRTIIPSWYGGKV